MGVVIRLSLLKNTLLLATTLRGGGILLATAFLLLIPLIAMQFTNEVNWNVADFLVAGILLSGMGITFVLITNKMTKRTHRIAVGIALAAVLLFIWAELAVGIIGS